MTLSVELAKRLGSTLAKPSFEMNEIFVSCGPEDYTNPSISFLCVNYGEEWEYDGSVRIDGPDDASCVFLNSASFRICSSSRSMYAALVRSVSSCGCLMLLICRRTSSIFGFGRANVVSLSSTYRASLGGD
jgi:hypothetical protein